MEGTAATVAIPSDLASRGFKPNAELVLTEALKRGKISPREIAAFIPKEMARDRELMTSSIAWISEFVRSTNATIMRDHEAINVVLPTKAKATLLEQSRDRGFRSTGRRLKESLTGKHTLLTEEEERELGRRILEENDLDARNELVEHNRRLVGWTAKRFWNRIQGTSIDMEDLVQEGMLGLITAAERYDYRVGRFTTYASWWIRQAIGRSLQNQKDLVRLPVNLQEMQWEMVKAVRKFKKEHGRKPTLNETSAISGIPVERIMRLREATAKRVVSLDQGISTHSHKDQSEVSLGNIISDERVLPADIRLEALGELEAARKAVNNTLAELATKLALSGRDRKVFEMFYGFDGSGRKRTLEYVGQKFSITRERIRQIIAKIWDRVGESGSDMDHDRFMEERDRIEQLEKLVALI